MANVVPCSTLQRSQISHPESCKQHLNKHFVQLAATNASSLNGLFLVSCRHLSQYLPHNGPYFVQLALQYKIACVRSLREAISSSEIHSPISDSTLALPLFLAHDEVIMTASLGLPNIPLTNHRSWLVMALRLRYMYRAQSRWPGITEH